MPSAYTRVKVLFGAEVWMHPASDKNKVIEFEAGQFAPAPHAHVYLVATKKMADAVVEAIAPVSDRFLEEEARRE